MEIRGCAQPLVVFGEGEKTTRRPELVNTYHGFHGSVTLAETFIHTYIDGQSLLLRQQSPITPIVCNSPSLFVGDFTENIFKVKEIAELQLLAIYEYVYLYF